MQIRAPISGVVVFNTIWKQGNMGEVQEGDQVRPGVPFMQVVDPSSMQVHVLVNQQDLFALRVGQKASVHLDAYPDLVLPGKLESIDPMGKHGDFSSKLRIFSATFSINGGDPRLMPDLSAAVDVHGSGTGGSEGAGQ
jgi:HlyD family secretion protein